MPLVLQRLHILDGHQFDRRDGRDVGLGVSKIVDHFVVLLGLFKPANPPNFKEVFDFLEMI